MSDDLIKLYSARILALAADMPATDPLDAPQATAKKRSPLCGSTVTVWLDLDDRGRIARYSQDVKACALGQASAAVSGAAILGCDLDQVRAAREQLRTMLREGGPAPDAPFAELEVLSPAREYRNRHASILLTLDATVAAIEMAQAEAALTGA